MRWFTFRDDIIFDTNGFPKYLPPGNLPPPAPPFLQRDPRYSWGYLCQMPNVLDSSSVNVTVVVFNRRTMGMAGGNTALGEYNYDSFFDTTKNVITLNVNAKSLNTPPPLRLGEWILDCTGTHGYFYRVVSITDISGNGTQFELEVQTPIRGFPAAAVTPGQTVILEGVVEVFERGAGRLQ
jgi:hypothetical protein